MRVLLLTTWYPTTVSPSSGTFVAKDAELISRAHEVRVVHLGSPKLLGDEAAADSASPFPVIRVPMSTASPLDILRAGDRLREHLEWADVLHTQAFSTLLPLARLRVQIPWVHTEHWSALSNPETIGAARHALPLATRLLRRPDVVTAVCEYLAAPVRRVRSGATRVVSCIVPPAPQLAPFPNDGIRRLVAVGGLVERKDPLLAIRAVRHVRDAGEPVSLRFVGDGPLRAEAQALGAELGIAEHIGFAGVVDTAGVAAELAAADAFFLPTRGENFCVSAAEAIVQGRPVVVGANGGQGEYIEDVNGETVTTQTPEAYAEALLRRIRRTPRETPEQVAGTIGDRFSPERVLDGYEAAYREARALRTA